MIHGWSLPCQGRDAQSWGSDGICKTALSEETRETIVPQVLTHTIWQRSTPHLLSGAVWPKFTERCVISLAATDPRSLAPFIPLAPPLVPFSLTLLIFLSSSGPLFFNKLYHFVPTSFINNNSGRLQKNQHPFFLNIYAIFILFLY